MYEETPSPEPQQAQPAAEEPGAVQRVLSFLRSLMGSEEPAPDPNAPPSPGANIAKGIDILKQKGLIGGAEPKPSGLLKGRTSAILQENIKTLRNQGLSEEEAMKRARDYMMEH